MVYWFDDIARHWARRADARLEAAPRAGKRISFPSERKGPCTVITRGNQSVIRYSVQNTFDGKYLTLEGEATYILPGRGTSRGGATEKEMSYPTRKRGGFRHGGAGAISDDAALTVKTTLRVSVKLGHSVILKIERQSNGSASEIKVSYGAPFRGIKQTSFTSDGKTIEGTVDHRRILPSPVKAGLKGLKFKDGKKPPLIIVDHVLERAIAGILTHAQQVVSKCSHNSTACETCKDDCTKEGLFCDAVVIGGCILTVFGFGVCVDFGTVGCTLDFARCSGNCEHPGNACCQVGPCPGGNCCDEGETCITSSAGVCCPKGQVVCSGTCCPPGIFQCNQNTCCPADRSVCSGVCCSPGQTCSTEGLCCPQLQPGSTPNSCKGICCPVGEVCRQEGICCPANEPVCNGVCCAGGGCDTNGNCCNFPNKFCIGSKICCPPFNVCCGSVCCDIDSVCHNGSCCPQHQACGSTCCPTGRICIDPQLGICAACPSGEVSCASVNFGGVVNNVCCPAGVDCCNGDTCCSPETMCCFTGGAWKCVDQSICIH